MSAQDQTATAASAPGQRQGRTITLRAFGRTGVLRPPGRGASVMLASGMLASGTLIGVAIGPLAVGSSAANAAGQVIAVVTGSPAAPVQGSSSTTDNSSSGGGSGTTDFSAGGTSSAPAPAATTKSASSSSAASASGSASTGGTVDNSGSGSGSGSSGTTTTPTTPNLKGIVIGSTASLDIADGKGNMYEVHLPTSAPTNPPAVGAKVKITTTKLANGTLTETKIVKVKGGPKTSVSVTGAVSYVDATDARYALSARGVSLMIAVGPSPPATSAICPTAPTAPPTSTTPTTTTPTTTTPTATTPNLLAAATPAAASNGTPSMPTVGQQLKVKVSLPSATAVGNAAVIGELSRKVLKIKKPKPPLEIAGLVSALDNTKRTVTISADGAGITTCKINMTAPASINLGALKLTPPQAVVAHATVAADGTYSLTGAAPDSDAIAAGSLKHAVGDFKNLRHGKRRAARDRHGPAKRHKTAIW